MKSKKTQTKISKQEKIIKQQAERIAYLQRELDTLTNAINSVSYENKEKHAIEMAIGRARSQTGNFCLY